MEFCRKIQKDWFRHQKRSGASWMNACVLLDRLCQDATQTFQVEVEGWSSTNDEDGATHRLPHGCMCYILLHPCHEHQTIHLPACGMPGNTCLPLFFRCCGFLKVGHCKFETAATESTSWGPSHCHCTPEHPHLMKRHDTELKLWGSFGKELRLISR